MTENRRLLPGEDPPPEPAFIADPAPGHASGNGSGHGSRRPNGLDHMGFLLQVVQVVPMMMSLFGLFLTSVWALRVTTAATVVVAWGAIMLLSHDRGGRGGTGGTGGRGGRSEPGDGEPARPTRRHPWR